MKNMKSRRINHKESSSVIIGFGAFCKYYRQKMFWWEGDLQVSVPSASLFLGGLKVWGDILVPPQVPEKFHSFSRARIVSSLWKKWKKWNTKGYLFTELHSLNNMYLLYDSLWLIKKSLKKIKTLYAVCVLCFPCPVVNFQHHGKAEFGAESTVWLGISSLCAGDTLGRLSLGRRDAGASLAARLGHLQPHALGLEPQHEACGPASCWRWSAASAVSGGSHSQM